MQSTSEVDVGDLTAVAAAVERAHPAHRPEIPPIGEDELRRWFFQFPTWRTQRSWIARDRATRAPVGWVGVQLPQVANRHHVIVRVEVVPEARGQGIGSALLEVALSSLDPARALVTAPADVGAPATWCEGLGLEPRQLVRESRLDITACDLDAIRAWLDPPGAVAAGYRVVSWRGPTPGALVPAACVAVTSMADAPMDDVDHEDVEITPELYREGEAAVVGRLSPFGSVALARDGSAAGYTELGVHLDRPVLGDQGDTVVVAAHRGHGLGRWLKARNLLAALEAHPTLRFVDTFNAESNPWMLSINVAMGFCPHRSVQMFQGPTPDVLDVVGRRSAR